VSSILLSSALGSRPVLRDLPPPAVGNLASDILLPRARRGVQWEGVQVFQLGRDVLSWSYERSGLTPSAIPIAPTGPHGLASVIGQGHLWHEATHVASGLTYFCFLC